MKTALKVSLLVLATLSAVYNQHANAAVGLNTPEDAVVKQCPLLKGRQMEFKTTGFAKERKAFLKYVTKRWGDKSYKFTLGDVGIDKFDLNEDGRRENLFYWYDKFFCNGYGGCKFIIFDHNLRPLEPDNDGGLSYDDILVLEQKVNSYHSIAFGGVRSFYNVAEWNGNQYEYGHTVLITKDGCVRGDGELFDFYRTYQTVIDANPKIARKVLSYLRSQYKGRDIKETDITMRAVECHLNDDGKKETLVRVSLDISDPALKQPEFENFIFVFDDNSNLMLPLNATDIIILDETIDSHHSIAALNNRGITDWNGWQVLKWQNGKYSAASPK